MLRLYQIACDDGLRNDRNARCLPTPAVSVDRGAGVAASSPRFRSPATIRHALVSTCAAEFIAMSISLCSIQEITGQSLMSSPTLWYSLIILTSSFIVIGRANLQEHLDQSWTLSNTNSTLWVWRAIKPYATMSTTYPYQQSRTDLIACTESPKVEIGGVHVACIDNCHSRSRVSKML